MNYYIDITMKFGNQFITGESNNSKTKEELKEIYSKWLGSPAMWQVVLDDGGMLIIQGNETESLVIRWLE